MKNIALGIWDETKDMFDLVTKIRDPQMEHSALIIFPARQDITAIINVLIGKGYLKHEDGHYAVTEKGEEYHNQLRNALNPRQQENNSHGSL